MTVTASGSTVDQDGSKDGAPAPFSIELIGYLNQQAVLEYPGLAGIDAEWTKNFAQHLHASSFEKPEFLATSVLHMEEAQ